MFKKFSVFILCLLFTINIDISAFAATERNYDVQMKQDLLSLMLSYPEFIVNVEKGDNDLIYCVCKSGKKILYDDKKQKTQDQKFASADLQDVLEQYYPLEKTNEIFDKSFDPGRTRNYALLNEVYGSSRQSIEKNLKSLKYGYTNYQFNSQNNANTSLESALKEVMPLASSRGDIGAILYPASGTYNYRQISGTGLLSAHAFGIAIDLKSDPRDYWKWGTIEKAKKRVSEYPSELVEAFENNGFVWGGKWGHFDILHFEYRPEIILKAKYFTNWNEDNNWYDGAPLDDENVKKFISIIDENL